MLFSTSKTVKKSSTGDDRRRNRSKSSSIFYLDKTNKNKNKNTFRETESDSGSTASSSTIEDDEGIINMGSPNDEYCLPLPLKPSKKNYEIAIIAMGNFWNPQRRITKMKEQSSKYNNGIKRVIAGYIGGTYTTPTFDNIGDHTMALLIEYNPKKVTYRDVLDMWYDNDTPFDEPTSSLSSRQERSALFVMNSTQKRQAYDYCNELIASHKCGYYNHNCKLYVDIEDVQESKLVFYQAEDYQQNYLTKYILASRQQFLLWANDNAFTGLCTIME